MTSGVVGADADVEGAGEQQASGGSVRWKLQATQAL
jgi:hypothetical protein